MPDALSRLSELSDDELDALIDIAQARAEGALTRRDLLKMGGGLAAAGVLGGSAVGSAAADASTSDGDWNLGEPGNRGDVFADGVDATSVSTNDLSIIQGHTEETVSVPSDFSTIQDAWDSIPDEIRRDYTIEIDPANYDDTQLEDLVFDSVKGGYPTTNGGTGRVLITTTDNTVVDVGSIYVSGCYGAGNPYLQFLRPNNVTPHDNEQSAIVVHGTHSATIAEGMECSTINTGDRYTYITHHGGGFLKVGGTSPQVDIGTNNVDHFIRQKSGGTTFVRDNGATGTVNKEVYWSIAGIIQTHPQGNDPAGSSFVKLDDTNTNGRVFNFASGTSYPHSPGELVDQGTMSLTAGGSDNVGRHNAGEQVELDISISSDPNADVYVKKELRWIDVEGVQAWNLTETTGNAGVDVDWWAYRRTSDL